jgi:hypothetical protein
MSIAMNCELVLDSVEHAFQTPQMIFNAHDNGAVYQFTDLFFDYPVPKPIVSLLLKFWDMDRSYGRQANISFEEYVKIRSNGGWQVHKHRELNEYEIVVPVYDLRTLGTLEYSEDRPSGVMENKLPTGWTIPFLYTIQFAVPTLNILRYPCVINNQVLPENCIMVNTRDRFNVVEEHHHGKADELYDKYHNHSTRFHEGIGEAFPWYDDWQVPASSDVIKKTRIPVCSIGITVEEDTPANVINLAADFDENFKISPLTKEFIYREGAFAADMYAPYTVSVFKNNTQIPQDSITVDTELNVKFNSTDLYSQYRIVISCARSCNLVRPRWYRLLLVYYQYLPDNLKTSIYHRFINGDWNKGIYPTFIKLLKNKNVTFSFANRKPTFRIDAYTGNVYTDFNIKAGHISDIDVERYTSDQKAFELEDRGPYRWVDSHGGDILIEGESSVGANKGNVGRVRTPYPDEGMTAGVYDYGASGGYGIGHGGIIGNANNQDARIITTTIIAGKTDKS